MNVVDLRDVRAKRAKDKHDKLRYPDVRVRRRDGSEICMLHSERALYGGQCRQSAAFQVSVPSDRRGWIHYFLCCADHLTRAVDQLCTVEEPPPESEHWGEHSCLATGALCETVISVGRAAIERLNNEPIRAPLRLGRNKPGDEFRTPGQPYAAERQCEKCNYFAVAKWGWHIRTFWPTQRGIADARREMGLYPIWPKRPRRK